MSIMYISTGSDGLVGNATPNMEDKLNTCNYDILSVTAVVIILAYLASSHAFVVISLYVDIRTFLVYTYIRFQVG